ncbi:spore coat protein [Priestia aryabhattai]|uniref:spore coat protein n=1 Tax=Priestia aryabhattai TaxID=412384 RepID=UPI001C8E8849|nr:spore coat protein [Priestia aryabhattai]MBX9988347.1 spore coat protein [Priestia aryabhattai]
MSKQDHKKKYKGNKWSALDSSSHPIFDDNKQLAAQKAETVQYSEESILIYDSADVEVNTTNTKVGLSIQAALQAAIVLILTITLGSSAEADKVAQELFQKSSIKQINKQRTIVKNSRNVKVITTDTDIAANVQILIQLLVALLIKLDIL